MQKKPECLERATIAESRLFGIESMALKFSNGQKRQYERLVSHGLGAVLIVPMIDNQRFYLIKEYAAGTNEYELGFPKGRLDKGESIYEAANRELMEEVGFGARQMESLKALSSSPQYFGLKVDIVIASDLYEQSLPGDEPEPIEVSEWSFDDIDALLERDDFSEARSIAALFMVKKHLQERGRNGK